MAVIGTVLLSVRLMFWSLIAVVIAALVTVQIIANVAARRQRLELETLAEIMAKAAADQKSVRQLRN